MMTKQAATLQDLKGFFDFYEIPQKNWLKIFILTERIEFEKGQIVQFANLPCKHVYIVIDGFIKLMSPGVRDTLCLTIMAKNSIWNEGTAFYQYPLAMSLIAGDNCIVYRMDVTAYRELVQAENDLFNIMHKISVRRIAALAKHEFLYRHAGPVYRCLYVLCKFEKSLLNGLKASRYSTHNKYGLSGLDIETLSQIAGVTSAQFTAVVGRLKLYKLIRHTYSTWSFDDCASEWANIRDRLKSMNVSDLHMDVVALDSFLNDLCAQPPHLQLA